MIRLTNQIELRHLVYFKMLAEELHYRKAAEKLFISQSALSQQIKQLEQLIQVSLFDRTNKKVALSESGKSLYKDAVQVLNKVEAALTNLELIKIGNTGQLRIGFVASAMQSVLPGLLKNFHKECPNIKFQLDELNNREQLIALKNEELDLGFMRSNHVDAGYDIRSVYKETFSLVLPKNHPINKETYVNMEQFRDEPFILFPNNQSQLYYQQIINLCADQGFTPKIAHRSIHAPTIFKLVEYGMGISIIPTSLAHTENKEIKFIELKKITQRTELYAVWKKKSQNPALPHLLEILTNFTV